MVACAVGLLEQDPRHMKTIAKFVLSAALLTGASFATGCAVDTETRAESFGQVRMALTGTSVEGNLYRLRAATFTIDGPASAGFATEDDPNLTVLSADLPPGAYTSTLGGDWYLERQDGASFVPVDATLVSANPADFTVNAQVASDLVYQFATDGTIVTIGDGSVNISIDVIESGSSGQSCTMFVSGGCPAGETCAVLSIESLDGVCVQAGTGVSNDPCDAASDCAPNHACVGTSDPVNPFICLELCNLSTPACSSGTQCEEAFGTGLYGVCF